MIDKLERATLFLAIATDLIKELTNADEIIHDYETNYYRVQLNKKMFEKLSAGREIYQGKFIDEWEEKFFKSNGVTFFNLHKIEREDGFEEYVEEPPYSEEDYEDALSKGLDLDDWSDYEKYYELGSEEDV